MNKNVPVHPAPANVRRLIRKSGATVPSAGFTDAVDDALGSGLTVEFYDDHPVGPFPFSFRLQRVGEAVQVHGRDDRHLGTFASAAIAIAYGWGAVAGMAREAAGR